MSTTVVTLDINPTAYTLTVYKGVRCLCITSRPEPNIRLLVYIELNIANLRIFKSDYVLPDMYIIATLLSLFQHIPYTSLTLEGMMSMERTTNTVSYFVRQIHDWRNDPDKKINTDIDTLFFDIEVDGTGTMFPVPDVNAITCISMKHNTNNTIVLTTFPLTQLPTEHKEYIYYEDEYTMIVDFIKICVKADRVIQYNGNSFDWPFLLARLNIYTLGSTFWTNLSIQEGIQIKPDTAFYPTPYGMRERFTLSIPTLEHVDLLSVCKRLFPFWPNTKLDTAGRELANMGKSGLEMKEYFQLIQAISGAKNAQEPLTRNTVQLLEKALIYSKVDCDVLVSIYNKLTTYRLLAHELCYLCAQDWSESTEAIGLLSQLNPFIVQTVPTKISLKLTIGLYDKVSVFILRRYILKACKNEQLKTLLLTASSSNTDDTKLIDFFQILAQLYEYIEYIDQDMYDADIKIFLTDSSNVYVGSLGAYVYAHVSNMVESLYSHDVLLVPAAASWLSVTTIENIVNFDAKGKAKICQPMPFVMEVILTKELGNIAKGVTENRLTSYVKDTTKLTAILFPSKMESVEAYMEKLIVTIANFTTYQSLLTNDEKKYITNRGEFVTLETVEAETGLIRVQFPYKYTGKLNTDYYVKMLKSYLTTLNKIISTKNK